jgi:hypothetical protein
LRRLQSDNKCLCAIDKVADSPPTIREFLEVFFPDVGQKIVITNLEETGDGVIGELATRKECNSSSDCVAISKGHIMCQQSVFT